MNSNIKTAIFWLVLIGIELLLLSILENDPKLAKKRAAHSEIFSHKELKTA